MSNNAIPILEKIKVQIILNISPIDRLYFFKINYTNIIFL